MAVHSPDVDEAVAISLVSENNSGSFCTGLGLTLINGCKPHSNITINEGRLHILI